MRLRPRHPSCSAAVLLFAALASPLLAQDAPVRYDGHQVVRVERAHPGDRYGDIEVDTNRSMEVYREWLKLTRGAPGPGGLRRPLWLGRAVRPTDDAYRMSSPGA